MNKRQKIQEKILSMLHARGRLSLEEVVCALEISEATARRYFMTMESAGRLIRIYGGVRSAEGVPGREDYNFQIRSAAHVREKTAIGRLAAGLVESGDRIFFDSGTTVLECMNALGSIFEEKELENVSIVTNSLACSEILSRRCDVSLTGGTIRVQRQDVAGLVAAANLERYHFTKAFLGADGIGEDGSLMTTDEETSLLARTAAGHSESVIVLADHAKLGRCSFVPYARLDSKKYTLVTDGGADSGLLASWRKNGVRILTADACNPSICKKGMMNNAEKS